MLALLDNRYKETTESHFVDYLCMRKKKTFVCPVTPVNDMTRNFVH